MFKYFAAATILLSLRALAGAVDDPPRRTGRRNRRLYRDGGIGAAYGDLGVRLCVGFRGRCCIGCRLLLQRIELLLHQKKLSF
jgi:hypothetical protein